MDDSSMDYEKGKSSGRFLWRTPNGNVTTTIFFASEPEARACLAVMIDIVNRYGYLTEADVADLTGRITDYTDNFYGWTTLEGVYCICIVNKCFAITFPKSTRLER